MKLLHVAYLKVCDMNIHAYMLYVQATRGGQHVQIMQHVHAAGVASAVDDINR